MVDLNDPPETIPPAEIEAVEATGKYICSICGYVYDPDENDPYTVIHCVGICLSLMITE